jgi:hypothetical protein
VARIEPRLRCDGGAVALSTSAAAKWGQQPDLCCKNFDLDMSEPGHFQPIRPALPVGSCCFAPEADVELEYCYLSRWAMCGQLQVGKENLHVAGLVGAAMCSASHDGISVKT